MKRNRITLMATIAVAAVLSVITTRPCAAQLTPTDLNPPGAYYSRAYCINASGQTAGFAGYLVYDESGNFVDWYGRAVLWDSAGNMTTLDPDGVFGNTEAQAMNDNGQVTGTWGNATGSGAFIWDSVHGMRDIGALSYNGVNDWSIYPTAINASGWVIGSSVYSPGGGWTYGRTWIYRDGTLEQVIDAAGHRIAGLAINDAGQVTGQQNDPPADGDYYPAVIWEKPVGASSPTVTILTPGANFQGVAINASGQVAIWNGWWDDIKIWQPDGTRNADGTLGGTLTSLGITTHYPSAMVRAVDIDDSGRIYGTAEYGSSDPAETWSKMWAWQNGAITDMASPGGLNNTSGCLHANNNGQFAGSYMVPGSSGDPWDFGFNGFIWNVSLNTLDDLPGLGSSSFIQGINDSGQMAGFGDTSDGDEHACAWGLSVPVNQPPTLTVPSAPLTGVVGSPVTFTATATDPDNDALTFGLGANAPAGASIDSQSGAFTWTPASAGTYTLDVTVTDAGGLSDTKPVTVDVSAMVLSGVTLTARNAKTITVTVMISNPNATTAYNVTVTAASLGGLNTTVSLPLVYGAIKPGASKKCTLQFKNVPSGEQTLTVNGTSSLGDFFTSQTVTVP